MSVNPIFPFGGAGISSNDAKVLDKLSYDEPTDTIIADSSLQVKPSTVYLGSAFGMSNAVQAVGFRLADGTDALCLVNRFDKDGGSYSNPKFFALGASSVLNVNLTDNVIMPSPVEVSYTTAGDNLTYSFEIKPAGAGRLRAQYWLGEDDSGAPVVDFYRDITQAEVDTNQPVLVEPNFYVLAKSSKLFVRFSGVDLKGNGTQPWFRSKVLPYKEITIGGHVEVVNSSQDIYIGCDYLVNTTNGTVVLKPKSTLKDMFRVRDYLRTFSSDKRCVVDLRDFNEGTIELPHRGQDVTFMHVNGDGWYWYDNVTGDIAKAGTGNQPDNNTSMHFGLKLTSSDRITKNGLYILNDSPSTSQPYIIVDPNVDFIELQAWDDAMSLTQYSSITLPLNSNGSRTIVVNYKTNNGVRIFRHKNASSTPYSWFLLYNGFEEHRVSLPTTTDAVYDIRAGYREWSGNFNLINSATAQAYQLDDLMTLRHARNSANTDGTRHDMTYRPVDSSRHFSHSRVETNGTIAFTSGNKSHTSTSMNLLPVLVNQASGFHIRCETVMAEHVANGMASTWQRKYVLECRRDNNLFSFRVQRWIHPENPD
ncbi:TPA: hypothetical protein ACGF3Q_001459 [Vibrio cholerae]